MPKRNKIFILQLQNCGSWSAGCMVSGLVMREDSMVEGIGGKSPSPQVGEEADEETKCSPQEHVPSDPIPPARSRLLQLSPSPNILSPA